MVASNDADLYIARFVLCYGPKLISLVHVTKQVGVLFWQGKNSPEEMQPRDLHIIGKEKIAPAPPIAGDARSGGADMMRASSFSPTLRNHNRNLG